MQSCVFGPKRPADGAVGSCTKPDLFLFLVLEWFSSFPSWQRWPAIDGGSSSRRTTRTTRTTRTRATRAYPGARCASGECEIKWMGRGEEDHPLMNCIIWGNETREREREGTHGGALASACSVLSSGAVVSLFVFVSFAVETAGCSSVGAACSASVSRERRGRGLKGRARERKRRGRE